MDNLGHNHEVTVIPRIALLATVLAHRLHLADQLQNTLPECGTIDFYRIDM